MAGAITFRHPPEVRERVHALRKNGMRPSEIVRETGLPRATVYCLLSRPIAPPPVDHEMVRVKAREMRDANMRQRDIAKALGLSRSCLYRIIGPVRAPGVKYRDVSEQAAEIDEMIMAGASVQEICERSGCSRDAIYKRRFRLSRAGLVVLSRPAPRTTEEQRIRMAEMHGQGRRKVDIAAEFGLTEEQVKHALRCHYRDHPEMKPKADPRRIYASKAEQQKAKSARRTERRRAMRPPREPRKPPVEQPRTETKPRPVFGVNRITSPHRHRVRPEIRMDRAEEQRAIEAAIAAGVGKRFEVQYERRGRQIQNCQEAAAYLEAKGLTVEVRRSAKTHPRYRVSGGSGFDGRWMMPTPFVVAVRAYAAQTTYRVIPLNEAYAQQMGA